MYNPETSDESYLYQNQQYLWGLCPKGSIMNVTKFSMRDSTQLRLGVDVDNVLADSARVGLGIINRARGGITALTKEDITGYPFHKSPKLQHHGISQAEVSAALDKVWRDYHREIKLVDRRAPDVLSNLIRAGAYVEIITTMGARDHSMRPNLYDWLDYHKIPRNEVTFTENSEQKVQRPLHTIIDDQEGLASMLASLGRIGFLYDAPWNRGFAASLKANPDPQIFAAGNWMKVGECAKDIMHALRS